MEPSTDTIWVCKSFEELSLQELYSILKVRSEVFVVEQNCAYQDSDGKDFQAYHVMGIQNGKIIAYTRILPKGISYPDGASIGRVLTVQSARRQGWGHQLMLYSIRNVYQLWGDADIIISAQTHLIPFYEGLGFLKEGSVYPEDGIEHIRMRRSFSLLSSQ